ncbi:MAG: lytic transglycosylase domain-containing protein [Oscillospiraceae bacterium]|nr:lytic transglycosylase domain-containing protein [Oscillospiraceae bacterium]
MRGLKIFFVALAILAITLFILLQVVRVQDLILRRWFFPITFSEYVERFSEEFDVDPLLMYSIIRAESGFELRSRSEVGAVGLMQVMEETGIEVAELLEIDLYDLDLLYDPEINIRIGIAYFRMLMDIYDNNILLAILAYNAGMGNVNRWIEDGTIKETGEDLENVPFPETNMYIRRVLRNHRMYQVLY